MDKFNSLNDSELLYKAYSSQEQIIVNQSPNEVKGQVLLEFSHSRPNQSQRRQSNNTLFPSFLTSSDSISSRPFFPVYRLNSSKRNSPSFKGQVHQDTRPGFRVPSRNSSSSQNNHDLDRKQFLQLQRKSIHGSLEDLKKINTNSASSKLSSLSSSSLPSLTSDDDEICKRTRKDHFYRVIISLLCQSMRTKSLQLKELAEQLQGKREECAAKVIRNFFLLNSWKLAKNQLKSVDWKKIITRKEMCYRIIITLVCQAMRRKSSQVIELTEQLEQKKVECAARVILHHLLLNSWRLTNDQLGALKLENTQMHKTIDNQALQLNIIRKMQSLEKKRAVELQKAGDEMQDKYHGAIRDNEAIKKEYSKLLMEKSCLETQLEHYDQNCKINNDLQERLDQANMELKRLEHDRIRADKLIHENEQLVNDAAIAKCQISNLMEQCSEWQEKVRSYEMHCQEMKLEMKNIEEQYQQLLQDKIDVSQENEKLTRFNAQLQKAADEYLARLTQTGIERGKLEKSYSECRKELDEVKVKWHSLNSTVIKYKKVNLEITEKMYFFAAKNPQRRRLWGSALYFLVNPFNALQRLFYGAPQQKPHGAIEYNNNNSIHQEQESLQDYHQNHDEGGGAGGGGSGGR